MVVCLSVLALKKTCDLSKAYPATHPTVAAIGLIMISGDGWMNLCNSAKAMSDDYKKICHIKTVLHTKRLFVGLCHLIFAVILSRAGRLQMKRYCHVNGYAGFEQKKSPYICLGNDCC